MDLNLLMNDDSEYLELAPCKLNKSPNVFDLTIFDVPVGLKVVAKKKQNNWEVEIGLGAKYWNGTWITETCIARWDNNGLLPQIMDLPEPRYGKKYWNMGSIYAKSKIIMEVREFCFSPTGKEAIQSTFNHYLSLQVARITAAKEGHSAFMNFLEGSL